jgi:periplasmic protein TonB
LVIYQDGKVIYREIPRPRDHQAPQGQPQSPPAAAVGSEPPTSGADEGAPVSSLPPGITGGRLIRTVRPEYPAEAIRDQRQGSVLLHGTVVEDGGLQELKVVSGDAILSQAAVQAVQQWKYEPYRRNGKPIDMPIDITIDFNLPK